MNTGRVIRIFRDEFYGPNGSAALVMVGPHGENDMVGIALADNGQPPYYEATVEKASLARRTPRTYLTAEEAQRLTDDLWRVGVRPSEAAGSAGQLAAVQGHLRDMRALAGHALKVRLP